MHFLVALSYFLPTSSSACFSLKVSTSTKTETLSNVEKLQMVNAYKAQFKTPAKKAQQRVFFSSYSSSNFLSKWRSTKHLMPGTFTKLTKWLHRSRRAILMNPRQMVSMDMSAELCHRPPVRGLVLPSTRNSSLVNPNIRRFKSSGAFTKLAPYLLLQFLARKHNMYAQKLKPTPLSNVPTPMVWRWRLQFWHLH